MYIYIYIHIHTYIYIYITLIRVGTYVLIHASFCYEWFIKTLPLAHTQTIRCV